MSRLSTHHAHDPIPVVPDVGVDAGVGGPPAAHAPADHTDQNRDLTGGRLQSLRRASAIGVRLVEGLGGRCSGDQA